MQSNSRVIYEFGTFRLDAGDRRLANSETGASLVLTDRVFETLVYLLEHAGELVDKRRLMDAVWPTVIVEDNNLEQCISALRQALGEGSKNSRYIVTVRGRGYRFAEAVRKNPFDSSPATADHVQPESSRISLRRPLMGLAALAVLAAVAATVLQLQRNTPADPSALAPRLVVLPFQALNDDERNASLALGMTETLIHGLHTADLTVASLSAVRRYATSGEDSVAIGRTLGAAAVLEGYVQRDEGHLRVSTRMLDVLSGRQIWSGRYDGQFSTIFQVQDEIAEKVQEALLPQLVGEVRALPHYTDDAEAYELYFNGRLFRQRGNLDALVKALAYFEQAAERDPDFALAYVGMADIRAILAVYGAVAPHESFPLAQLAVDRALELTPDLAEAHASLGHIRMQYTHDWPGAELELRRAVELNPYYALGHQWLGLLLAESGRFDEGLVHLRRAHELEPIPVYGSLVGMVLNYQGRFDEAIEQLEAMLDADPRLPTARSYLTYAYLRTGRFDAAAEQLTMLPQETPGGMGYRGQLYALTGRHDDARAEVGRLIELARSRYVPAYDIATIFAVLGDSDATFHWLARAFEERSPIVAWLPWDGAFDGMRDDPRYSALLTGLNVGTAH